MFREKILNRLAYAATLGQENIFEVLDFAKDNNFSAVEINLNVPVFFPEKYNADERRQIKERVENQGIKLSFHAPEDIPLYHLHPSVRRAGLERLKECIDFASQIGGEKITIHPGESVCFTQTDKKIFLLDIYRDRFANLFHQSLVEIREYARGKIMPCIENVGNFNGMIRNVLGELLAEGDLFLTWDIGHSYGQRDNQEFFIQNLQYVKNCHIHDHNGVQDHQVIGDGKIDFIYYLKLLENLETSFVLEIRPVGQALISRERLVEILDKY